MPTILLTLVAAAGLSLPGLPARTVPEPPPPAAGAASSRLDGLLRLPPLVSPGETIEIVPLNPARTPPGGRWFVAGVEARPAAGSQAGALRLQVRLPLELSPLGPLPVVYEDPRGERLVEASGLEQVRVVPAGEPETAAPSVPNVPSVPSVPRLSRCGSRWVQDGVACACGWFPGAARDGILIDGRPAGPFVALSRRSACARVGPGPHRLSGSIAAGFDPLRDADQVDAVQIRRFPPFLSLRPLQSVPITWVVLGTREPVRLRLRNTAPELATLEGGAEQTIATSGGLRNAATRRVAWLAGSGPFRIEAEVEDKASPFLGREYLSLLDEIFLRELWRLRGDLEARLQLLAGSGGGRYAKREVLALLDGLRGEIPRALPYPELTAFRDSTAELLDETAAQIELLPAAQGRLDERRVQPLLRQVRGFLSASLEAPRRSLCILSSPEEGATVKIYPRGFPSAPVETSTADIVSDLFPGKYRYEIRKDSFKGVESEVDLTGQDRVVLDCRLTPAAGRARPAPCRLASASERDSARCRW